MLRPQLSFVYVSTGTPHPRTATGSVRGTDSVAGALLVPSNYRAALLRSRFPFGPGMSMTPVPFDVAIDEALAMPTPQELRQSLGTIPVINIPHLHPQPVTSIDTLPYSAQH